MVVCGKTKLFWDKYASYNQDEEIKEDEWILAKNLEIVLEKKEFYKHVI